MKAHKKTFPREKPISLQPLVFVDALKGLLAVKPDNVKEAQKGARPRGKRSRQAQRPRYNGSVDADRFTVGL